MPNYQVTQSDRDYADRLTKQIKSAADDLWSLLLQAWEVKAHVSLGYKSWGAYIESEFDFNRQRSYQLINQGRVIRAIRESVSTSVDNSPPIKITEAAARDIYPVRQQVAEEVRDSVASGVPVVEAVRLAVETHRSGPSFTRTQFNDEFIEEPSSCAHEYVCRHCGELLQ